MEPETEIALKGRDLTLYCHVASTSSAAMSFVYRKDCGKDFPAASERRLHVTPRQTPTRSASVLEVPRFVKPMVDKVVSVGETAVLECQSSGSPRPQLAWRKDGGPLAPTERHFFTADNQLLTIVKVEDLDGGQYECEMTTSWAPPSRPPC